MPTIFFGISIGTGLRFRKETKVGSWLVALIFSLNLPNLGTYFFFLGETDFLTFIII